MARDIARSLGLVVMRLRANTKDPAKLAMIDRTVAIDRQALALVRKLGITFEEAWKRVLDNEESETCPCPCCSKPVLRVDRQTSLTVYWHEIGAKPSQRWGCAVALPIGTR